MSFYVIKSDFSYPLSKEKYIYWQKNINNDMTYQINYLKGKVHYCFFNFNHKDNKQIPKRQSMHLKLTEYKDGNNN